MEQRLVMTCAREDGPGADLMADLRAYLSFSDESYLDNNTDVAEAGVDPFAHFIEFGRYERARNFGFYTRETWARAAGFDPEVYTARNPDVVAAGLDPLSHFVQYGFWEGRLKKDVPSSVVWEQLGLEPSTWTIADVTSRGRCPDLDGIERERVLAVLALFLRRGPSGLYKSEAAITLSWLALSAGEPVIAEAFCETYRLGPPYFLREGEPSFRRIRAYPASLLRDYCEDQDLSPTVLARCEPFRVPSYSVATRTGTSRLQPKMRVSDGTATVILPDVTVFPGEGYILTDDNVVIVSDVDGDDRAGSSVSQDGHILLALAGGWAVVDLPIAAEPDDALPAAISFLGTASLDLADHLFNRLGCLVSFRDRGPFPVLVEPSLPSCYVDLFRLLEPERPFVTTRRSVRVEELHLIFKIGASHFPPPSSVASAADRMADGKIKADGSRLFMVKGFPQFEGVVNRNSAILTDYLKAFDFHILNPTCEPVREQLDRLSRASVIVAEFGPALILCLVCRPGTQIVILCNEACGANFDLVAFVAAQARCKVMFYQGLELKRSRPNTWRNDYLVDIADFGDRFRTLIA